MEFQQAVRRRRMVRRYTSEPVPEERLVRILDAARRAPSAGFSQGQSFVVVTEPSGRAKLARIAGEPEYLRKGFNPWISSAPVLIVPCVSEAVYRDRYREPDKAAASREWPVPYWWVDGGCALMLLLLAAVDEGLAAGLLDLGPAGYSELRRELGIPDEVRPIGLVTLGHAAPDRRSRSLDRGRRPADSMVHRERWRP